MGPHRVGLIGCGWIAPFHLAGLAKLGSRVRIVWAADPDLDRAQSVASQVGARVLTDYRYGLHQVDCAFVLAPHHLHHAITLDCLAAGCHVLLEKPMAMNLKEADDIIAAAERARRTLMVGYPHRYRKSVQIFRETLLGGKYGRLFMLDGLMDESLQEYTSGWIARRATLGGGVFFSASPHMLDVMLWIGGDVQTISMVGTRAGCDIEGEDTAASVMRFKNGIIGATRHTWSSPKSRVWYSIAAMCEKAHVILTTTPLGDLVRDGVHCRWSTTIVSVGQERSALLESGEGLDLAPEIDHFFKCVTTGAAPQTGGLMAREMIRVVLQAYSKAEVEGGNV